MILNVFLRENGFISAIDEDGRRVEKYCKAWTEILPILIENPPKEYKIMYYFGTNGTSVGHAVVRYLWLSICRDEDLIAKSIKVVRAANIDGLDKAIRELETALRQRGRTP